MKKMKLFAIVLIALLLIAACGRGGTTGGTSGSGSYAGEITFAPYMFGPWDPSRDVVVGKVQQTLAEKYGINVTLTNVYVEYSDYRAIINTRIAGGTAPDIWLGLNESGIRDYYSQGVIASWDVSFFRQNAPIISAYIDKGGSRGALNTERWWQGAAVASGTGKMVTLPSPPIGEPYAQKGVVYRGDWLANLGVTNPPAEMNDWIALMRRFVNEDPNRSGRRDTYAFSISMIKALFSAHGVWSGFSGDHSQWYYRDGRVQNADTLIQSRQTLEVVRQLYADGLIDPTFVEGENSGGYWAISTVFVNGRIGVSAHASFDHYRKKEVQNDAGGPVAVEYWAVNGANSDFVFGPWINGPGGHGYFLDNDYGLGESYVYNIALERNQAKLATIFKILDVFATDEDLMMLSNYGIFNTHYDFTATGAPRNLVTDNPERNALGIATLRSLYGPNNTYHPTQNEFWYKAPNVAEILRLQAQPNFDTYLRSDITGFPASRSLYSADLYAYRDETFIGMITGTIPINDSTWSTYVREYLARGGQVLEDEANAMYRAQH
jgi:putative aldouronate transport system substrate-binding protein